MEVNLTDTIRQLLQAFLLLILPWIFILIGMVVPIESAWYFVLCIIWFGSGIIFFAALN